MISVLHELMFSKAPEEHSSACSPNDEQFNLQQVSEGLAVLSGFFSLKPGILWTTGNLFVESFTCVQPELKSVAIFHDKEARDCYCYISCSVLE